MKDNVNKIITNSLQVKKDHLKENIKSIIMQIKKALELNKDIIINASSIDNKNNNGFIIDFDIINQIFCNLEKENIFYGDVTFSQENEEKKIIYKKEIMDIGNVLVISEGNFYIILEMIIRNIKAGNTVVFVSNGFMYKTNQLLIEIIQTILEKNNISRYLVQMYVTEDFDEILANFANIDLIICIGSHSLQNLILSKAQNKTLLSGYENFDLYIEDTSYIEFLNKIINTGLNIQLYINSDTKLDHPNAIIVSDIDEAIAQINYNGSRYSASIFTSSNENASKFIKEVKAKTVTVNTSPTIERILDVKQTDLINEKTIIYPFNFELKGTRVNIEVNKN